MKRYEVTIVVMVMTLIVGSCVPVVEMHQPNILFGGRTMSLSTHPGNNGVFIAAAESGGLFTTGDGGVSWSHVNSFPEFWMGDVKFAPSNANIIIATCGADTRTVNGGGIWRSSDGGHIWYMPPTGVPAPSNRHPQRMSAFGISFEPNSNDVYVGTDNGMARSTDLGVTWVYQTPEPTLPINGDRTQDRIFSVLARGNGRVNALGTGGIYYTLNGGTLWNRCVSPWGDNWVIHGLAMSPLNPDHVFLTLYLNQLFLSTDGGQHWNTISRPSDVGINRPSFIQIAHSVSGNQNQFDLYYGNDWGLYRKTCTGGNPSPDVSNGWSALNADHSDPSDVTFDITNTHPILLATDGGVHMTADDGANWTLTGGGKNGFQALQMTEVNGQVVQVPTKHVDLYFGTQDNNLWASSDRGATWPNDPCCEGFFIGTDRYRSNETNSKVSFVACGACGNLLSDPHMVNVNAWPNVPGVNSGNPFIMSEGKYIQTTQLVGSTDNIIEYTNNVGGTWTPKVIIPQALAGPPQVITQGGSSVIYQGVSRAGVTPSGDPREGLVRIDDIGSATPTIRDADGPGFGCLGIFPTMFAWYRVIGVSPGDPDHVIIADIQDDQMKVTRDGGLNWTPDVALTNAVTDNGNFLFRVGPFPEAHAIAFNPFHSCDILVGTAQNGIIRSTDGGNNWSKIPGSEQITNISAFFFENGRHAYVSSYGRGLWQLNLHEASCPQIRIPPVEYQSEVMIRDPRSGVSIPLKDLGNPDVCPPCGFAIVRFGEITGLEITHGTVRQITINKGEVVFVDRNKKEVRSKIGVSVSEKGGGFGADEFLAKATNEGAHIRGLILHDDSLRAIITSDNDISRLINQAGVVRLADETKPRLRLHSPSSVVGQNIVSAGDTLTIEGKGFVRATKAFTVFIGEKLIDSSVVTDEKGEFRIKVSINLPPGIYKVVVRSKDRETIEAADYINVVVQERMKEK